MYTKWDEYSIHQTQGLMDEVVNKDKTWAEHFCQLAHCKGPGPYVHGLTNIYPNTGVSTASLIVVTEGKQYNMRVSKEYQGDPTDLNYGPLSFSIDEPLVRWSMKLEDNPHIPVTFDLQGTAEYPLYDFGINYGQKVEPGEGAHYIGQLMRYEGDITIEGQSQETKDLIGFRDKAWGVRTMRMGEDVVLQLWHWLHFKDYAFFLVYAELADSTVAFCKGAAVHKNGTIMPIKNIVHDLAYQPEVREWNKWDVDIYFENGRKSKLTCKLVGVVSHMYGSGMMGPVPLYTKRGPLHIESETWDTTNRAFVAEKLGKWGKEYIVEADLDGDIGYGFVEDAVSKKSKYGPMLSSPEKK